MQLLTSELLIWGLLTRSPSAAKGDLWSAAASAESNLTLAATRLILQIVLDGKQANWDLQLEICISLPSCAFASLFVTTSLVGGSKMNKTLVTVAMLPALLCLVCLFNYTALAQVDIEFVVDASGSMKQKTDGVTQIDAARAALEEALREVPAGSRVALRAYGHRVAQTDKDNSCKDTQLLVPFSDNNKSELVAVAGKLTPLGYTPIAYSLLQVITDFPVEREGRKVIILLSDGEETCGGYPAGTVKQMLAQGFEVKVFTVGFNVDSKARKQLEEVASVSGGEYFDARSAKDLKVALIEATKKSVLIDKDKTYYGQEIRGGNDLETAVAAPLGKEFRLDHHQKPGDYDYFFVDLRRGQRMRAKMTVGDRGLEIDKKTGKASETVSIHAQAKVVSSSRNKLIQLGHSYSVSANSVFEQVLYVQEDGRYYLVVGHDDKAMNKDHLAFTLSAETSGDAGTDRDAGKENHAALEIKPGTYESNYFGPGDLADLYKFSAKRGEKYVVGVRLADSSQDNYSLRVSVLDDFSQKIANKEGKRGEGLKTEAFPIKEDGDYFVLAEINNAKEAQQYILMLKKVDE